MLGVLGARFYLNQEQEGRPWVSRLPLSLAEVSERSAEPMTTELGLAQVQIETKLDRVVVQL
jgi:hypothetical protein